MPYKRKYPSKTISEINRMNALSNKNIKFHHFTDEERSRGGSNARDKEREEGKKLNHGMTFGKKDGN